MSCAIEEMSFDEKQQMLNNVQNNGFFWGDSDMMSENTTLEDIASYIHTLNNKEEILSYRTVRGRRVSHINDLNVDIMTPTRINQLARTIGKGADLSSLSLEAGRNMLAGKIFHDVIMKEAWGWVMQTLANYDGAGAFKSKNEYQLAIIPGKTIQQMVASTEPNAGVPGSLGYMLDEMFGVADPSARYVEVPSPDTLLGYLLMRADEGVFSDVHKFRSAGKDATARVTFERDVMYDVASYVRNQLMQAVASFAKVRTAYKGQLDSEEAENIPPNVDEDSYMYPDMIIGTNVFAFSPKRNQGGFIDLMFISADGKRTIINDFKTKTATADQKFNVVSPVNASSQSSINKQLHVYMDAMRQLGTKPLFGQAIPATMELGQSNIEIGGESNFKITRFIHAGNLTDGKLKAGYDYHLSTYSSALVPQLEKQATVLSDFITQNEELAQQNRATLRAATLDDDTGIWSKVSAQADLMIQNRLNISKIHQSAFEQLIRNFNISQYLDAAMMFSDISSRFQQDMESYIRSEIPKIQDKNTPQAYMIKIADQFLLYQDQIVNQKLQAKALRAVFNSEDRLTYIDGLIRMTVLLDVEGAQNMTNVIQEMMKYIPQEHYALSLGGKSKSDAIIAIEQALDKRVPVDIESALNTYFKPAFLSFFDNISAKIETVESALDNLSADILIEMMPKTFQEEALEAKKKRVVVPAMSLNQRLFESPELIENPLFKIFTRYKELNNQRSLALYEERMKEFDGVHAAFKQFLDQSGLSYNKGTDLLIDKKNGMLWTRFTEEFNELKVDAIQENDDRWMKEHFEFKDYDSWREGFEIRRKNYQQFLDREVAIYNAAGGSAANAKIGISPEIAAERLLDFEEKFNLETKLEGNEVHFAWTNRANLVHLQPREVVFEKYSTKEFANIQENKALFDMYEQFLKMTEEAKNVLGGRKAYIPDEFFPNFKAEVSEMITDGRMVKGGVLKSLGLIPDLVLEEMRIAPIDETMGVYNEETFGRSGVPFSGIIPLVTHDGNIFAEGNEEALQRNAYYKSFDLYKVASSFISSIHHYAQFQYTEPIVQALNDFARGDRYLEEAEFRGMSMETPTGETRSIGEQQEKSSAKLLKQFTNFFWYGIRYTDLKSGKTPDVILNPGNKQTGKGPITLISAVLGLKNKWSRNVLGFAFLSGLSAGIAGGISSFFNAVEGQYFDVKTLRGSWKKYRQSVSNRQQRHLMRAVALHFDAASVSTETYRAMKGAELKNKALSDWTLYGALRTPDMIIGDVLTDAILESHGILQSPEDPTYSSIAPLRDLPEGSKSLAELIEVDEEGNVSYDKKLIGEFQVEQIKNLIRRAIRETYGQLPENTLMGAQLSVFGTLATTFATWMPALINKRIGKTKVIDLGSSAINYVSVGRYSSIVNLFKSKRLNVNDKNEIETPENMSEEDMRETVQHTSKTILRSLLDTVAFILSFGAFSSDSRLNTERMRTKFWSWAAKNKHEIEKLGRPPGLTKEEYHDWLYEKWLDGQRRALRSATVEAYVLSTIWLLLYAARLDYDDDGKADYKKYWAARMFVKTLTKTHSELLFLLDPSQLDRMITQPLPVTGLFSDLIRVGSNSFDEIVLDMAGFSENSPHDKSPVGYYSLNFFTGFRQARRIFEPFEQDVEKGLD